MKKENYRKIKKGIKKLVRKGIFTRSNRKL